MSSYTLIKTKFFWAVFFVLSCYVTETYAQVQYYPVEQVEHLAKKQHRKAVIQIYTTWSEGYKELQNAINAQQQIARYLNDNFIVAKFDAETRNDINFQSKTYRFVTQSGVSFNELAAKLLEGQLVFPTLVFLDEDMNIIQNVQFRSVEQFEMTIRYFGEDMHKKMPWRKYEKSYQMQRNR